MTSLDAPTVAVVWMLAFAWAASVRLPLWLPVALALAAWSVYIGDRLLDARRAYRPQLATSPFAPSRLGLGSLRPRHNFHWRHRRIFLPVALGSAIGAVVLFLHSIPLAGRGRNSILAAAALAYFTSVHSPWRGRAAKSPLRLPKELLVGILFTLACAMPAWARSVPPQRDALLLPLFVFIGLAWLNCHAIESWESSEPSARFFGIHSLGISLGLTSLLTSTVAAVLHQPRIAALLACAALSAALLAMLDRLRSKLTPTALRAAADLALLTPLLLVLF